MSVSLSNLNEGKKTKKWYQMDALFKPMLSSLRIGFKVKIVSRSEIESRNLKGIIEKLVTDNLDDFKKKTDKKEPFSLRIPKYDATAFINYP